jgi:hypothetical protein
MRSSPTGAYDTQQQSPVTTSPSSSAPTVKPPSLVRSGSTESELMPIRVPKRRDPYHRTVQLLLESENLAASVERLPPPTFHGRSVTVSDNRSFGQSSHRRAFSMESPNRRSSSFGNPSRLRYSMAIDDSRSPLSPIDDDIIKEGHPLFSEKALPRPPVSLTPHYAFAEPPKAEDEYELFPDFERPESALPNIDKALPALPSYLVPDPLFSASSPVDYNSFNSLFSGVHSLWPQGPPPARSRFSCWTTASEDCNDDGEVAVGPGYDDDDYTRETTLEVDERNDSGCYSSTFSSIGDSLSGHTSPIQFSDPFSAKTSPRTPRFDERVVGREPSTEDAASEHGESIAADAEDEEKTHQRERDESSKNLKHMTQMEQLMNEFEYLGAALI